MLIRKGDNIGQKKLHFLSMGKEVQRSRCGDLDVESSQGWGRPRKTQDEVVRGDLKTNTNFLHFTLSQFLQT